MLFILILGLIVGNFLNICIYQYCKIKLYNQHLIRIFNLILYLLLFYKFYFTIKFLCYSFLVSLLLIIFVIDLKRKIIPNKIIFIAFAFILILKIFESFYLLSVEPLIKSIFAFFAGAFPLFIIILVTKGGMGAGDMKLIGVIAMWFGFKNAYLILFISIISAAVVATILLLAKKIHIKSTIAFAPFISISTFVYLMWGQAFPFY